jgi:hypothetical protein
MLRVYGTGNTRPGVVGWSDQDIGVKGVSAVKSPAELSAILQRDKT